VGSRKADGLGREESAEGWKRAVKGATAKEQGGVQGRGLGIGRRGKEMGRGGLK